MTQLLGVRVENGEKTDIFEAFNLEDVILVDTIKPKNHSVPCMHTNYGAFACMHTLSECKDFLGDEFVSLSNGALARLNQIAFIVDYGYTVTVYFKDSHLTGDLAKTKRKLKPFCDLMIASDFIPETF